MNEMTLLIMAAGMGSRYGGLKQLDEFGPNGESIIEFSVYDAIQNGFREIVFIIRKEFEKEFRRKITSKFDKKIPVKYVFQSIDDLPKGFQCPAGREKPWGTGHAILAAAGQIHNPFAVINADDFYGRESFRKLADFYANGHYGFSMVAYRLDQTLSPFGGVTRAVCSTKNGFLSSIVETANIRQSENGITSDHAQNLNGSEAVSVNMWGFTPQIFNYLKEMFVDFLNRDGQHLKSEFLLPTVVNDLILNGQEQVTVLNSSSYWFGVTFKEDKASVREKIGTLVDAGIYPKKLF